MSLLRWTGTVEARGRIKIISGKAGLELIGHVRAEKKWLLIGPLKSVGHLILKWPSPTNPSSDTWSVHQGPISKSLPKCPWIFVMAQFSLLKQPSCLAPCSPVHLSWTWACIRTCYFLFSQPGSAFHSQLQQLCSQTPTPTVLAAAPTQHLLRSLFYQYISFSVFSETLGTLPEPL